MLTRLYDYAQMMRWDKPIGALLLLWPTLWALWLAGDGQPNQTIVLLFLAGVWITRSGGCVVNDIADRDFDRHVERTRDRPLATGRVSAREATVLAIVLGAIALGIGLALQNLLVLGLAVIGALVAISYPFIKRLHHLPQAHLGIAFGWGIPIAYAATHGDLPAECWWLFAANAAWVLVYDTEYAMADREDDLKIGVKSSAILFAENDTRIIGLLQITTLVLLAIVGVINSLGAVFFAGLLSGAGFFVYQQQLIKSRDRHRCFDAFLNNTRFGLWVFCAIVLDQLPTG